MKKIKNVFKKGISIFLAVLLILTSFPAIYAEDIVDDGRWNIELGPSDGRTFIKNPTPEDFEYLTGEPFMVLTNLEVSGTNIFVENGYGLLKVKKSEYVAKPSFTEPTETSNTKYEAYEDDEYWYAKYTMPEIRGGMKEAYPVGLNFKPRITPQDAEMVIEYGIYDSTGNPITVDGLVNPVQNIYKAKVNVDYTARMFLRYWGTKERTYSQSYPDQTKPVVSEKEPYVNESIYLTPKEANKNGYGLYVPETLSFVVDFKKYNGKVNVKLRDTHYNTDTWKLDKDTGRATITVPRKDILNSTNKEGSLEYAFSMQYGGSPIKIYLEDTLVEVIADKGKPSEKVIDLDKENVLNKVMYTEATGELEVRKNTTVSSWYQNGNEIFSQNDKSWGTGENEELAGFRINVKSIYPAYMVKKTEVVEIIDTLEKKDELFFEDFSINEKDIYGTPENKEKCIEYLKTKGYKLVGIKYDGTEKILKEKVVLDEKAVVHDTKGEYKSLKAVFPKEDPLLVDHLDFYVLVNTGILKRLKKDEFRVTIRNKGEVSYKTTDGTSKKEGTSYLYLEKINITANVDVRFIENGNATRTLNNGRQITYKQNPEERKIELRLDSYLSKKCPMNFYKVDGLKQVLLLPEGIDYLNTKTEGFKPKIIKNYKNSGKTAVIYDFGDLDPEQLSKKISSIYLEVLPTSHLVPGKNEFKTWLSWEGPEYVIPYDAWYGKVEDDKYDLDGDGNIEEKFPTVTIEATFAAPLRVNGRLQVSENDVNWTSGLNNQDIGSKEFYELKIENKYVYAVKNVVVLDTLPYIGDHKMASLQDGSYPKRGEFIGAEGSTFTTPLIASVESLEGNAPFIEKFDIYYSTTPAGATIESVSGIKDWKKAEEVTDFKKIKNLKFVLKKGLVLKMDDIVKVVLPVEVKNNKKLTSNDIAINSFAYSVDGSPFMETNETYIKPIKYLVEGIVFKDDPKDGMLKDKKVLSNHKVELINVETGEMKETTTNDKGEYKIPVYKRGKYKVKFYAKKGEKFTDINKAEEPAYSNLVKEEKIEEEFVAYSDEFVLDTSKIVYGEDGKINKEASTSLFAIRNAGILGEPVKPPTKPGGGRGSGGGGGSKKPDPTKPEPVKPEPVKPDPTKPDPVKPEPVKPDPTKPDPKKPEPVKPKLDDSNKPSKSNVKKKSSTSRSYSSREDKKLAKTGEARGKNTLIGSTLVGLGVIILLVGRKKK